MIETKIKIKPLSVNVCWQGKRFKTKTYLAYEQEMILRLPRKEMIFGPKKVSIEFGFGNCKLSDADNYLKPLFDILTKRGYWEDDRYVYELHVVKKPVKKGEDFIKIKIEKSGTQIRLSQEEKDAGADCDECHSPLKPFI